MFNNVILQLFLNDEPKILKIFKIQLPFSEFFKGVGTIFQRNNCPEYLSTYSKKILKFFNNVEIIQKVFLIAKIFQKN